MAKINDDPAKGIKANIFTLKGRDLQGMFDPVITDIDRLVCEQICQVYIKRMKDQHPQGTDVRAVFLVGDFGSSLYLRDAIAAAHPDLQVIQSNDAWSAIARGAVLSKPPKETSVVSSVAANHYGILGASTWDDVRDKGHEDQKYWDKYEEIHYCAVVKWCIHKVYNPCKAVSPYTLTREIVR